MATKKAGSAAKKTTKKSPAVSKPSTTTKVTTVKAVEAASPVRSSALKSSNRTFVASALIAEFVGTFILASAFIVTKGEPLYLGFVLIAVVLIVGTLSGAHVNPLLTVGAWVTRKMTTLRALGYIVAQVLGAALAFVMLSLFIGGAPAPDPNSQAAMMGQQPAAPELLKITALTDKTQWYVFFAELVGATIFAFAVASARRESVDRVAKAFTVGFGLFVSALLVGTAVAYATQTNVPSVVLNPAIALVVEAVNWSNINWMAVASHFVAPLIGGVLGFALLDVLYSAQGKKEA